MSDEKRVITTTRTLALIKDLLKDEMPGRMRGKMLALKSMLEEVAAPVGSWRALILEEMAANDEGFDDVVAISAGADLDSVQDDRPDASSRWSTGSDDFYVWTADRIYFVEPAGSDRLICTSVPRNPSGDDTFLREDEPAIPRLA